MGFEHFFNVGFTWCVFNKSACQPYLHASLTVPFWRSSCTATWRLARFSQFRFNNHAPFSSLCLPWPWGILFPSYHTESLLLPLLCKMKKEKNFSCPETYRVLFMNSQKEGGSWAHLSFACPTFSKLWLWIINTVFHCLCLFLGMRGAEHHMHTQALQPPFGLFI